MKVLKCVLTGGPCGGKTSALKLLKEALSSRGFKVLTVPEAASEIVAMGTNFKDITVNNFQSFVIERELQNEYIVENLASFYSQDVIILCDRGLLDNKAYMPYEDFVNTLSQNNLTEFEAYSRYDAVFHLVTTAIGAEEHYKLEGARFETPEEARKLDFNTLQAWAKHPNHHLIDNSTNFTEKMNRLLNEILKTFNNLI